VNSDFHMVKRCLPGSEKLTKGQFRGFLVPIRETTAGLLAFSIPIHAIITDEIK
jgi:hypothetical protein